MPTLQKQAVRNSNGSNGHPNGKLGRITHHEIPGRDGVATYSFGDKARATYTALAKREGFSLKQLLEAVHAGPVLPRGCYIDRKARLSVELRDKDVERAAVECATAEGVPIEEFVHNAICKAISDATCGAGQVRLVRNPKTGGVFDVGWRLFYHRKYISE